MSMLGATVAILGALVVIGLGVLIAAVVLAIQYPEGDPRRNAPRFMIPGLVGGMIAVASFVGLIIAGALSLFS